VVDRSLKTFLRVTMTTMLLLGPLRPATAWAQLESAAAKAEPPLDEAMLRALIQRVRASDDSAIAEFEKLYTSVMHGFTDDSAETLADESVEDRDMDGAYIMLSLAEARGSRNARTIGDMLFEREKFEKLAYAQNIIGERLYYGVGIAKDAVEAVKWFRLAAAQGDAAAQENLGWMYYHGAGVPKDAVEAVKWFRLSAVSGNPDGELSLAMMYDVGAGVSEDDVMAVKWYRAAAMQDMPTAQLILGRMYRDGEGVPTDLVTAYAWLLVAMEGEEFVGDYQGLTAKDVAKAKRDFWRLGKRLSASQHEQARELANRLSEAI
jgi:TPR repeat protein